MFAVDKESYWDYSPVIVILFFFFFCFYYYIIVIVMLTIGRTINVQLLKEIRIQSMNK